MKGYRTLAFNILSTVVPIVSLTEWNEAIPAEYLPYWLLFVALVNILLRMVTTTPVGRKA